MRKSKILKSLLIPTLGIAAIGTVAAVATSCSCGNRETSPYVVINAKSEISFELKNFGNNAPNLEYSLDGTT
jgi:hypothetical protein